jgi:hypothetical protein
VILLRHYPSHSPAPDGISHGARELGAIHLPFDKMVLSAVPDRLHRQCLIVKARQYNHRHLRDPSEHAGQIV